MEADVMEPVDTDKLRNILVQTFFRDYLNRYKVLPLVFEIAKQGFRLAGKTKNNNLFTIDGEDHDVTLWLRELGIDPSVSLGGDFVVGHDYAHLREYADLVRSDVGVSIFDTANHGYDSLFLASHIRSYLLNMVDHHLRRARDVQVSFFEELNDMMRGPITRDLLVNTLPLRQRSHGAVGIYGQLHTDTGDFNFFCAGLPLFYYSAANAQFYYLEPDKGQPLGYFANKEPFRKRYVPHNVQLQPGDTLILATDGCFESETDDECVEPVAMTYRPLRHFKFQSNSSLDVMSSFNEIHLDLSDELATVSDPAVRSFCGVLEPYLRSGADLRRTVEEVLNEIDADPFFTRDDRSLILIQRT